MKRTITIDKRRVVFYRRSNKGVLVPSIFRNFGISCGGRYEITITEGTEYLFKKGRCYYILRNKNMGYSGVLCAKAFDKLFFSPNFKKRYDITVKEVTK